jgi:hypothetical protein
LDWYGAVPPEAVAVKVMVVPGGWGEGGVAVRLVRVSGLEALNVAVTVVVAVRVNVQEPVPLHPPPLQPVKVEPVAGAAERVTEVPLA